MKPSTEKSAPSGFGLHDALYIIFKHKWKILLLTVLGLSAAGAMYYKIIKTPTYESQAQLMIRYVVERTTVDAEAIALMKSGGMLTEVALLNSVDTATEVAREFGPEKLLPLAVDPTPSDAAGVIIEGITTEIPSVKRGSASNMLNIGYRNQAPEIAVGVLEQIIETYMHKHFELHRSKQAFEQVQKRAEQARSSLAQTEEEINRLKEKSGVLNIEATNSEFEERRRLAKASHDIAEADLAEQRAKVEALERSYKASASALDPLSEGASSKDEEGLSETEKEAQRRRVTAIDRYKALGRRLELFEGRRDLLLLDKLENNPKVRALDRQISDVRAEGFDLVQEYPELSGVMTGEIQAPVTNLEDERALASALQAKLETISGQKKALESEVAKLSALGFQLQGLERRRQIENQNHLNYQASLVQFQSDDAIDRSNIPNISIIQSPSPPVKSIDEKSMKVMMGLAGSGLALGLGLAFLIEMVIDRKVSRSVEIEARLQLPLLMSIPLIRTSDGISKLIGREPGLELLGDAGDVVLPPVPFDEELDKEGQGHEHEHFIVPYTSAIRDRVIFNFEVNNINHKPKLVAVTGLTAGAGTSTVAAGLAKAFAETEGRKILLVDLNPPANRGRLTSKPTDSLVKALQISRQESFHRSSRSLYFASAPTRRDGRTSESLAPTKLNELMPYLTASDFDYIIFDMPPVDPTSPTQSMAGFMDKVILVLDGQRTTKEGLQRGYGQLAQGSADVSCVYNKARSHAPQWVEGAA